MSETVLRHRYRAYPDGRKARALSRLFGCCRVVANDAIAARRQAHRDGLSYPTGKALSKALITQAKHTEQRAFLAQVSAVALQKALADVDAAYRNFFDSFKGNRKGRPAGAPRFWSRHDSRQSARFTRNARFAVAVTGDRQAAVRLPKVGDLRFVLSRPLPSDPSSVSVIREADGRCYVSFVVRVTDTPAPAAGRVCGIDVGLASFATRLSLDTLTGTETTAVLDTPLFLRRRARALARSQRALARKQKGSANRAKARHRVAVQHRKVREARLDHAHQQAAAIVAGHDVNSVEDLSITGMARTNLARSVHDQAMGQFLSILAEKAARQGRTLVKVGRFYPSNRICSTCHALTGPTGRVQLHVRTWTCNDCGVSHDRDVNAARNILTEGLRLLAERGHPKSVASGQPETVNARGGQGRPPAPPVAPARETGRTTGDQDHAAA